MADRERYDGPLRAGMIITGRDNDGVLGFRRDLLLGPHPGIWIYEALPCPMRRRIGSGVGEIGTCPELNIRMIMQPEESDGATEAPGPLLKTLHPEIRSTGAEQLGREGMVTVWDAHGRMVGCMGVEVWLGALPASDPPAEPRSYTGRRSFRVNADEIEVVKLLPNSPPVKGERILVGGFPCKVTRCRVKWDGDRWTIKTLRVKREATTSG